MNQRLQELAAQAGFENGHQDRNGNSLSYELEKFAELIVRECADVGSKFSQAHPEDICYQIKRHFGVEE